MGEDPGTSGTAVTTEQDPEQLRKEIERSRQELGDTVAALAAKTDVKAQAKRRLEATKSSVAEKKDELVGKSKDASPAAASDAASQVAARARANPLPVAAAGAFLAGVLAGRMSRR